MWGERLAAVMVRRWVWVIALVGAITALAGWQAASIGIDNSLEIWLLEEDETLQRYHRYLDRFEADDVVVVGVFADDVLSPESLATIDRITTAATEIEFVVRARSLTDIRVAGQTDGDIQIQPLIDEVPTTTTAAAALRKKVLANELVSGSLVSEDATSSAILANIHPSNISTAGGRAGVANAFFDLLDAERARNPNVELAISGGPPLDESFVRYTERDFALFGPIMVLLVLAAALFVFRRWTAALIPMSVVIIGTIWTFGATAAIGFELNVVSSGLVGLILAVGVADSIHILADYYQELMKGSAPVQAVRDSLAHLFVPCLFTSLTTSAGMLSLTVSQLKPVREFGISAAMAVIFAFLLSITLVPAILRAARPPDPKFIEAQKVGPISKIIDVLARPTKTSSVIITVVFIAMVGLAGWGVTQIEVAGSNPMNYFHPDDPIRQQTDRIDAALGGSATVEAVITAPDSGLLEPEKLKAIATAQKRVEQVEGVSWSLSFVDLLEDLNGMMTGEDRIPDSPEMVAQLGLLLEGEDSFEELVQEEYSVGRISAAVKLSQATDLVSSLPVLEADMTRIIEAGGMQIELTGITMLMGQVESYLVQSQIESFSVALIVVSLMMIMLLRSWKLGLFSMIPNCAPIVMGLGFMSLVGIDLDPGTVMIGSIALGLVVDDTVHFLVRFRQRLVAGDDIEAAIAGTMHAAARPLIITSVILAAAFAIMLFASFTPNVYFGAVSAVVILLALAADLIALPALLVLIRPKI